MRSASSLRAVRTMVGTWVFGMRRAQHVEPAAVGKRDVENQQIDGSALERASRFLDAGGRLDAQALAFEIRLDDLDDLRLVVDDQNTSPARAKVRHRQAAAHARDAARRRAPPTARASARPARRSCLRRLPARPQRDSQARAVRRRVPARSLVSARAPKPIPTDRRGRVVSLFRDAAALLASGSGRQPLSAAGVRTRCDSDRRCRRSDSSRQLAGRAALRLLPRGAARAAGRDADSARAFVPQHVHERAGYVADPHVRPMRRRPGAVRIAQGRLRVPRRDQPEPDSDARGHVRRQRHPRRDRAQGDRAPSGRAQRRVGTSQPRQRSVSSFDEPRAAHAAQRHPRIHRHAIDEASGTA